MNVDFPVFAQEFGYGLCLHDSEIINAALSHRFRSAQVDMTWQLALHLAPGGTDNPDEGDYLYTVRFLDCGGSLDLFALIRNEIVDFQLEAVASGRLGATVTVLPHEDIHTFTCAAIEEVSLVPATP
ncbi:MAG TPA: hypothetical protein VMI31_10575 [Fimbriimonadaceae bacterium]|nr:hypothetical protein [Fimbriimonadaceae bacterium]